MSAAPRPVAGTVRAAAIALFLLVALNAWWWARAIPENGAPDEYEHIATQQFVAAHGRLPGFGEGRFRFHLMDSVCRTPIYPLIEAGRMIFPEGTPFHANHRYEVRQPYLFSPQLAHLLGGTLARLTGGFSLGKARAVSSFWIAAAAVAVFLASRRLWPRQLAAALLAGLTFGLWPQVTFLGAYVNDDALALAATSLLLLACSHIETDGISRGRTAALGLALGLVALSKPYAYAAFPLAGLWMIRSCVRHGMSAVRHSLLSVAIALTVAGSWYVWAQPSPATDPGGGVTGAGTLREFNAAIPPVLARQTNLLETGSLFATDRSILEIPFRSWLPITLLSSYGAFGWMDVPLPWPVYGLAALVLATALAGLIIGGKDRRPHALGVPFLFSFPLLAIGLLLSLGNSYYVDYQPQGRYLLPSIPGIAMLASAGTVSFPGRSGRWAASILPAFMAGVNLCARLFVLR